MKSLKYVVLLSLVMFAFSELAVSDEKGEKWEKVSKDFRKVVENPKAAAKEIIDVVKRMAALNDKRAVVELMKETLFHKNFEVCKATFEALIKTSDEKAIEAIAKNCAGENDANKRFVLLKIVSHFKTKSAMDVILKAAESSDWRHKLIAAQSLPNFKDELLAKNRQKTLSEDKNILIRYHALKGMLVFDEKAKLPDEFNKSTEFIEGKYLPETLYCDTIAVFVDFSNDMDTSMALPERDALKKAKELAQQQKKEPSHPKKKDGKEPSKEELEKQKEEEYKQNFVVSRLKYAKQEVIDFLSRLPKGVKVKLYRVSSSLRAYKEKPVEVTKDELTDMKKFLDDGIPSVARNWELALRSAFEDANIDTAVLVGCGGPDGSKYDDYAEFLQWFEERNWMRGLTLHILGIRADYEAGFGSDVDILKWNKKNEREVNFLRQLAQIGGGNCGIIDHKGKVAIPEIPKEEPKKEEPKKEEPKPAPKEEPKK
jgi:hypothetical protein